MKLLTLLLFTATYASAQERTLADYARQERARQAEVQSKNIKVYTTEDIRTTPAVEAAKPDALRMLRLPLLRRLRKRILFRNGLRRRKSYEPRSVS